MVKKFWIAAAVVFPLSIGSAAALAAPQSLDSPRVIEPVSHDVSPPLREMRLLMPPLMQQVVQNRNPSKARMRELRRKLIASGFLEPLSNHEDSATSTGPFPARHGVRDTELQIRAGQAPGEFTQPLLNFDGIGYKDYVELFSPRAPTPPHDSIAVGMHDVMEVTNYVFAAYDKSDGSLVFGPFILQNLWAGFPACDTGLAGGRSAAVMYDQWAQRWIISLPHDQSYPYGNVYCLAVSVTSDPGGAWYRYMYALPGFSTASNKLGIWPNAYLATLDRPSYPNHSELFLVFNREALLQGTPANVLAWDDPGPSYGALPASVEGLKQPPADSPPLFASYTNSAPPRGFPPYSLLLYEIENLDWSNPGRAQLLANTTVSLPPFNDGLCNNLTHCIPEPAPGVKLDAVSDRLMYPLAYRNFGDHETLVVNQTVTANASGEPPAGIRWYEFDTSSSGANDWALKQSGTYEPDDGLSRWMGSLAMDASGDMALGFSLSGPNTNPSIVYTGRKASAPAGKMIAQETTLIRGGGVAIPYASGSWGPFSSMRVDPYDGCTFWYANEYLPAPANSEWNTRIGAFRFPGCQTPVELGELHGTVTDAATSQTIAGAEITLVPNFITDFSGTDGQYHYSLPPGQYTARVFDFGYKPAQVRVTVADGSDVEQDFALVRAPMATLSGRVTDHAHGYGLYAELVVVAQGVGQVATAWTDPATGKYSVKLPEGFDYTISVAPYWDGYETAAPARLGSFAGDTTQNFSLQVGATCSAPGYAVSSGFSEDFNGSFPPRGWSVVNGVQGSPVVWKSNTAWGDPNWTGGTGQSADMNSSAATTETGYVGIFNTSLITPPIPVSTLSADPVLQYKMNYAHYSSLHGGPSDAVYVYISSDVNPDWSLIQQFILHGAGTPFALPGAKEAINLQSLIPAAAKTVRFLWQYEFLTASADSAWYTQIDDVMIGACHPVAGGLVSGRVTDANTGVGVDRASVAEGKGSVVQTIVNPEDAALAPGSYVAFSTAGQHQFTATAAWYSPRTAAVTVRANRTVQQNFKLGAGKFSASRNHIEISLPVNETRNEALTIDNAGTVSAYYHLVPLNAPVSGSGLLPDVATPSAATARAGSVVSEFTTGSQYLWGLGVDRGRHDLWLGNPHPTTGGNNGTRLIPGESYDVRYLFDGTLTHDRINVSFHVTRMNDLAYDDVTGVLWQVATDYPPNLGTDTSMSSSHVYELDPRTLMPTGKTIPVPSAQAEAGLAFDPVSNTFYAGDPDSQGIYHFDASGQLLGSLVVGVPVMALAYNSGTGHLFALAMSATAGTKAIYVFDAKHGYALVNSFDVPGFNPASAGAGMDYDCAGHLWLTDTTHKKVYEVVSGEQGWCSIEHIPWLTLSPPAGTLGAGDSAAVMLYFNGAGEKPYTTSQAQLRLAGRTPYPVQTIPVTVHWEAQPAALTLSGSAAPSQVNKDNNIVYTLTVENAREAGHGSSTETELTYKLPAGVSFVSASGDDGVNCPSPSDGTLACQLGRMAPGASRTVTIAVRAGRAGTLTSVFKVEAREPNDSGKTTLEIGTRVIGDADIGVSGEDATLTQGGSGTVHLTVANAGPDTATDVVLKIAASGSEVKLQSAAGDQGQCASVPGNGFECDLGDIAAGGRVGVNLKVFGAYAGQAAITAHATTSANADNSGNDVTTAAVTVNASGSTVNGGGGGGGFGWLGLAALLGLAGAGLMARRRIAFPAGSSSSRLSGDAMSSRRRNKHFSLLGGLALAAVVGVGLIPAVSQAQPRTSRQPQATKSSLRSGLTAASVKLAQRQLAPPGFVKMAAPAPLALLAKANRVGPRDPQSDIHLTVSLKLRHVSQLKQFLQEVSDPASPDYHRFLTPAEFTAKYGPTRAAVAAVERYLKQQGITVTSVSSNRLLVHARGTTLAFEKALGVRINNYRLGGRSFFGTEDRSTLPVAVARVVQAVVGLNNAAQFRSHSHFRPLSGLKESRNTARPASRALASPPGTSAYYNPLQIAQAYDWPSITGADSGTGVTIAIVTTESENLDQNAGDWETFWSAYGLPEHTVNIINVGNSFSNDGLQESVLDIEWSGAMAPGATLNVYSGANPDITTFIDLYNRAVTDQNPDGSPRNQVMTTSWGFAETGLNQQVVDTADAIFMQGASEGISMFAAAGDDGTRDRTPFINVADFPSSDPYVTAANGTVLNADINGNYISEKAWSDTGGAISQFFPEPAWQTGPGVPQNGHRNNSDLALNAGVARPDLMLFQGRWSLAAGTSLVAPQLAALFAIGVWQDGGRMLGQSNKLIYDLVNANAKNYANDFHDVTAGCNGKLPDNTTPSCAKVNWDHPTGWGSPKGSNLLDQLGVRGPFGTLQGTVTGAASGQAVADAKVVVTPNNLSRVTQSDGSYKILLAPGTYTVTVSDFGYKVATASVTISDGGTTTQDFQLVAPPVAKISGKVKDASGHGYALYAKIEVMSPGYGQVADAWSNPADGSYHLSLPEGFDYEVEVAATLNGYDTGTWRISDLAGNQRHNFGLMISTACTAPGYKLVEGFGEDFNAGAPPAGWRSSEAPPGSVAWTQTSSSPYFGFPNVTGGTGLAALVKPGLPSPRPRSFDAQLITPPILVSSLPPSAQLSFLVNYQHVDNDALDVGISNDGGRTWTRMAHLVKSYGAPRALPGGKYTVNVSPYIPAGTSSIELRWSYVNETAFSGNYAEVDDVSVGACEIIPGGLVQGQVADANTGSGIVGAEVTGDQGASITTVANPADPNLPLGFYLMFVSGGNHSLTATSRRYSAATVHFEMSPNAVATQNIALDSGQLTPTPAEINVQATVGTVTTDTLTIANTGSAITDFDLREFNLPVYPPAGTPRVRLTGPIPGTSDVAQQSAGMSVVAAVAAGPGAGAEPALVASPAARTAGTVIATFPVASTVFGLGVDRFAGDLWIASPVNSHFGVPVHGDDQDHRFLFDGTDTGDRINVAPLVNGYSNPLADMAFDVNTGMLWQLLFNDNKTCIYELDTVMREPTGKKICPGFLSARDALAYDPVSGTWLAGAPDNGGGGLYQFNARGQILGARSLRVSIWGMAYNPGTGHLFVLVDNGLYPLWVFDAGHGFLAKPIPVSIPGFNPLNAGAALGFDCAGHLWITDQVDQKVFEVASGEKGWCSLRHIPWLALEPPTGRLDANGKAVVTLNIDGTGQKPFTTSQAQLRLFSPTPYNVRTIPVTVHWVPQPVTLTLSGSVAPLKLDKGDSLVYTLKVANGQETGHGPATQTVLVAELPAGVSYASSGGDGGVQCTAPSGMAVDAPAAGSAPRTETVRCQLGALAPGATKTVTIAATAKTAGTLTTDFKVSAREPNDSGQAEITLSTTVTGDADIAADVKDTTLTQGSTGQVQVEVANGGPDTATGVVLEVLGGGSMAKLQGATSKQGQCAPADGGFKCNLGDIPANGTADVTVTVFGTTVGSTALTANVTTSAKDKNNGNNVATATVTVNAPSNGGGSSNGGGGSLGWLVIAALLGLIFVSAWSGGYRRS